MNKVTVLVEGYARPGPNDSFLASSTTSLIETSDKKILVDPGANKELLLAGLAKLNIKPEEISLIYISHYHPDHFLNINLFPNLDIYEGTIKWRKDKEYFHSDFIPGTDIAILPTPGHTSDHSSLLVSTKEGVICIAGDVFWWEDGQQKSETKEDLLSFKDPYATDEKALMKSRDLVLEKADPIIPGHGKIFKNPTRLNST
ncbi:hypothetical protein A2631_04940 [Candidatus Daviesbacteria bacterium RIFCSPHIGHO2_01_FULL_44_29]|uniref:Metallo-beta-lactamase domain-containing protein 1 n=1 Tax=Candidatus Daviesbacteria bacterium RIFCSPHIGHO2_02_FULL_43_12 TaxID=1797776 RepID=A0A1F5KGQ8_9BACT|nr:MAG: hypothetical protein A2631_04940 [Candidatus Daviesbacteria bacterium RIFCSPHIGHO2_01_FULL_44_29]OGE40068.1 MAG: hypothetical protein A3D25_04670 [Candidatus Daviesbacteria bacterium RIFCSPHIGHO2_02_FULL_43_12]OGE41450.1 MAG: hypothetical protein A3E86_05140 [Candidatus Daviesbacteria bacterium RIFCSPHIGHO2_12_FULL_47_45]OGE70252.1 MAG: hypothetical protein A3B55_00900 [Candidatus Daviesbacteria bacterium RIFCSPLOWO2_01_FULL_43_15]